MTRQELIKHIITCAYKNKAGHIAPALSILQILMTMYNDVLKPDDQFILSKGHGCLALYAVLMDKGILSEEEFYTFTQFESILGGHPSSRKIPDVKLSTGSLGHGLPFAVGLAMARKINNLPGIVYCLIGDGEANEGSIWEAVAIAGHRYLDNIVCIVDNNKSSERALEIDRKGSSIADKFSAFHWSTYCGGDSLVYLEPAMRNNGTTTKAVIIDTIKGHGCRPMENDPSWHHRQPKTEEELNQLLSEIY